MPAVRKFLFICGRAKQRSLTAEEIFASEPNIEARAAGISKDSDIPVTSDLINWADQILVMEKSHKSKLTREFNAFLKDTRIGVLNIPDKYNYMDPILIDKLRRSIERFI